MKFYSDGYVEVSVKIAMEYWDHTAEKFKCLYPDEVATYIQYVLKNAVVKDMSESEKGKRRIFPDRPLLYIIDDDHGW